MRKEIFIFINFFLLVSCNQKDDESYDDSIRMQTFPKMEIIVDKLPAKENLWVFILAGQSNMAGRALVEPQDTLPSNRILSLNKTEEFIVAKEPLHFYETSRAGLDCGLTFGRELLKHIPDSVSLLLIPTAVGGSSLRQWLEDSTYQKVQLFKNFAQKMEIGKNHGTLKGILWHQGESDAESEEDIKLYTDRLSQLFINFRASGNNEDLPILIGKLGSFSKNNQQWQKINNQIALYVSTDDKASLIETADLKDKGDKVHFNSEAQRIMGKRFANAYTQKFK